MEVLRTSKPPVISSCSGVEVITDPRKKAPIWQSAPNFAGLRLDGSAASAANVVPPRLHEYLNTIDNKKLTVVNMGDMAEIAKAKADSKFDAGMDELRKYTSLMDKFGLNQFMIYRGQTLNGTPEFEAFRNKYNHDWGSITGVIRELEDFLRARGVKLAIINGPRLHEIASLNLPTIHKNDLISCISNIDEILSSGNGLSAVSVEREVRAATRIQAKVRSYFGQIRYKRYKDRSAKAIIIQTYARRMLGKRIAMEKQRQSRLKVEDQWETNVEKLCNLWPSIEQQIEDEVARAQISSSPSKSSRSPSPTQTQGANAVTLSLTKISSWNRQRLVIMIPSLSAAEYLRLSIDRIHTIQNMHISCLYQLADPHVHIVYISPVQLTSEEVLYHERFLHMMGISLPVTQQRRLHFVVPESISRLPQHLPMAQVLWYSTSAIRKVKSYIRRIPNAVIVPTAPTWADRRLSNLLNIPMLSPDPLVAETVRSRSYMKKVFAEASVNVPIGAHDINSIADFYVAFPRLITSNIEIRRWIFRLNTDFNNEGYAYLDVDKLSVMAGLRTEMKHLLESTNNNVTAWYSKQVQLDVRKRILNCLRNELAVRAVVCRRDLHGGTWEQFERYIKQYGLVIEAEPITVTGYVNGLCFIDPHGNVQVTHGVDVIMDDLYQVQGYVGPQTKLPQVALRGATTAIGEVLYSKWDITGYVTIEYQAFWDVLSQTPKLCAIGAKFGLTPLFGGVGSAAVASGGITFHPALASTIDNDTVTGAAAISSGRTPISRDGTFAWSLIPNDDKRSIANKSFVYIPYTFHTPLISSRDEAFLKFCRMNGITFDPENRTGTLFFHIDSVVSGSLSILCVGSTRKRSLEITLNCLTFVVNQYGKDKEVPEGLDHQTYETLSSILYSVKMLYKREFTVTKAGSATASTTATLPSRA